MVHPSRWKQVGVLCYLVQDLDAVATLVLEMAPKVSALQNTDSAHKPLDVNVHLCRMWNSNINAHIRPAPFQYSFDALVLLVQLDFFEFSKFCFAKTICPRRWKLSCLGFPWVGSHGGILVGSDFREPQGMSWDSGGSLAALLEIIERVSSSLARSWPDICLDVRTWTIVDRSKSRHSRVRQLFNIM